MTQRTPVPPAAYMRIFELHPEGQLILDDLVARFGGQPYRKGGTEAARQTDFNAGSLEVVNHIVRQIARAHEGEAHVPEDPSEVPE